MNNNEFYKPYNGANTVVIFIHGILEKPKQFRQLAALAYREGYSVAILLLPGHGESGEAFANTHLFEWVDCVNHYIDRLSKIYPHVILVGHSMGALLEFGYCSRCKTHIRALVAIGMPLRVHLWPRVVRGAIKIAQGKVKKEERYIISEYKAIGVGGGSLWTYMKWLPRYIELLILIQYVNKHLEKICVPILIIQAKKDEFVSLDTIKRLDQALRNKQIIYLYDSGHFCYHQSDLYKLEKSFISFLRENRPQQTRKIK